MGIYLYVGPQLSRSFCLKQIKLAWPPEAWWASSERSEVKGQMLLETKPVQLPSFNLLWISLRTFSVFYFPQETHLEVN